MEQSVCLEIREMENTDYSIGAAIKEESNKCHVITDKTYINSFTNLKMFIKLIKMFSTDITKHKTVYILK